MRPFTLPRPTALISHSAAFPSLSSLQPPPGRWSIPPEGRRPSLAARFFAGLLTPPPAADRDMLASSTRARGIQSSLVNRVGPRTLLPLGRIGTECRLLLVSNSWKSYHPILPL